MGSQMLHIYTTFAWFYRRQPLINIIPKMLNNLYFLIKEHVSSNVHSDYLDKNDTI